MPKNSPLKAGQMRQSRGPSHSGNAKAVEKRTTYREPHGPATGRTANGSPPPKAKTGRGTC